MSSPPSSAFKTIIQWVLGGVSVAGVAALLTIAYTMWYDSNVKSAQYGELKASLAYANGQLNERKTEIENLKAEKGGLQKQIDVLQNKFLTEQNDNRYDKKLLDESERKTKQLEERVTQLSESLKKSDPCAPLRDQISDLEEELQRSDFDGVALTAVQRSQAESSLAKKYKSLDVCQSSRN